MTEQEIYQNIGADYPLGIFSRGLEILYEKIIEIKKRKASDIEKDILSEPAHYYERSILEKIRDELQEIF